MLDDQWYFMGSYIQKSSRDRIALAVVFGSQEKATCYTEPHRESVSSCWSQGSPLSLPSNGVRELLQCMLTFQDQCALKRKGKLRSLGLVIVEILGCVGVFWSVVFMFGLVSFWFFWFFFFNTVIKRSAWVSF